MTTRRPSRILVVDDDRGFRHAMAPLARRRPATASSRRPTDAAALDAAGQRRRSTSMLLDVGLPGMSGLDVLAAGAAISRPLRAW